MNEFLFAFTTWGLANKGLTPEDSYIPGHSALISTHTSLLYMALWCSCKSSERRDLLAVYRQSRWRSGYWSHVWARNPWHKEPPGQGITVLLSLVDFWKFREWMGSSSSGIIGSFLSMSEAWAGARPWWITFSIHGASRRNVKVEQRFKCFQAHSLFNFED